MRQAIQDSGLPWTMLRPAYFMQNALMLSGGIRKTGSFALPAADAAVAQIRFTADCLPHRQDVVFAAQLRTVPGMDHDALLGKLRGGGGA